MRRLLNFIILLSIAAIPVSADDSGPGSSMRIDRFARGQYRAELSYPVGTVEYGSTVELKLRIFYPENESYILLPTETETANRYSNTVIISVEESAPVLDGSGLATTEVVFSIEAWLPGSILFPPLTLLFGSEGIELSTDEIEIDSVSGFKNDEQSAQPGTKELSPLYLPEPAAGNTGIVIFIIAAGIAAAAVAAAVVIIVRRRRKMKKHSAAPVLKTPLQLRVEFRRRYIDVPGPVDLRAAFSELVPLLDAADYSQYRSLIEQARFSKEGIEYADGYRLLVQLFGTLTSAENDESPEGGDEH